MHVISQRELVWENALHAGILDLVPQYHKSPNHCWMWTPSTVVVTVLMEHHLVCSPQKEKCSQFHCQRNWVVFSLRMHESPTHSLLLSSQTISRYQTTGEGGKYNDDSCYWGEPKVFPWLTHRNFCGNPFALSNSNCSNTLLYYG